LKEKTLKDTLDLFRLKLKLREAAKGTQQNYLLAARHFLDGIAGEKPTELELLHYIERIRKKNSKNFQNLLYWALRSLYRELKWEWPISRGPVTPDPSEIEQVVMPLTEVEKLIRWTKKSGTAKDKALLALSTIYGLRREEILRVKPDDIDKENKRILIHTAKRGRKRWHIIPDVIWPFIAGYNFSNELYLSSLCSYFNELCQRAEVKRAPKMGWHSIRHALVDTLKKSRMDIDDKEGKIHHYMRWQRQSGILHVYTHYVDEVVDREIFAAHPFLKWWEEK